MAVINLNVETRRIHPGNRQVGPCSGLVDLLGGGRTQAGGEFVEIVIRLAREDKDLAGAHIERDGRAFEGFELIDGFFGCDLQVKIQGDVEPFPLVRRVFLQRRIDAKSGGIDAINRGTRLALQQGVVLQFQSVAAGRALETQRS